MAGDVVATVSGIVFTKPSGFAPSDCRCAPGRDNIVHWSAASDLDLRPHNLQRLVDSLRRVTLTRRLCEGERFFQGRRGVMQPA